MLMPCICTGWPVEMIEIASSHEPGRADRLTEVYYVCANPSCKKQETLDKRTATSSEGFSQELVACLTNEGYMSPDGRPMQHGKVVEWPIVDNPPRRNQ
jgi:hypothetical protein